jgi:hypothetical protein
VVAGHRAGVRGGGRRAYARRADLENRDPDAGLGARRQRLAQPRSVALVLHEQGDGAHPRSAGEVLDVVGGRDHRPVAARDRRVQPQPAARGQRVDDEVAALGDERDVAGLRRVERVAPQRRARVQRDDPVAVGAAHRQVVPRGRRAQLGV